ncbi:hypothetical protein N7462_011310 [Penicillium macrosclerotiorum]|uniref:uncharacterized protein n=1 Tax=Penicillium macrosclerotiorum TaxID=303699 RepID=UPI002547096D|nr:uncharacterized protein N7462_011310 [Penicillium macrosclerotiorum]KAJ5666901.1 hypothetical protein N7462_011310 [Penicillium macrosclerotiorum]
MKTFVDNVCRQVVERHIMQKLPLIFEPTAVSCMSDEELARITTEPEQNVRRRKELQSLVNALEKSLEDLEY